jgi:hypothetical protein
LLEDQTMRTTIKAIDTPTLRGLVFTARCRGYTRPLPTRVEARLDPAGFHVLSRPRAVDTGLAVRVLAALKLEGRKRACVGRMDVDFAEWLALPDYKPPSAA